MNYDQTDVNVEEEAAKLRIIAEEIKADIKAGRYKGGQVHQHISAKNNEEKLKYFNEKVVLHTRRYGHPDIHSIYPHTFEKSITGRFIHENPHMKEIFHKMEEGIKEIYHHRKQPLLIMDDYFGPTYYKKDRSKEIVDKINGPTSMNGWIQPIPPSNKGLGAGPSEAKRAKLRAKRKKNK